MVYVFTNLGIHVSTDDEGFVLRDAVHKGGYLVIEIDEVRFFTNIDRAVAAEKLLRCCRH